MISPPGPSASSVPPLIATVPAESGVPVPISSVPAVCATKARAAVNDHRARAAEVDLAGIGKRRAGESKLVAVAALNQPPVLLTRLLK